jgi:membrane protease YdiL (CAAX protease family)
VRKMLGPVLLLLLLAQLVGIQVLTLFGIIGSYVNYIYVTIAYVTLTILLWLEKDQLGDFHLDRLTLVLFVLSSLFRSRLAVIGESFFLLVIGLSGIAVGILVIRNASLIQRTSTRWAIIAVAIGLTAVVPTAIFEAPRFAFTTGNGIHIRILPFLLRGAVYQLSFTVLIEELVFRAFFWGYLIRFGWKESNAMWMQAIVFWLLHFTQASFGGHFIVAVPLSTAIYTLLTKKSRQVFPAVLSHTILNTITPLLLTIFPTQLP